MKSGWNRAELYIPHWPSNETLNKVWEVSGGGGGGEYIF